ncbi:MAG: hypothetical protein WCO42_07190 [bacterium]
MESKTTIEKLQFLLPHWIEHNKNHEAEFRKWSASARSDGAERLAGLLDQAAASMAATDEVLKKAVAEVGGSAHDHHHHHH